MAEHELLHPALGAFSNSPPSSRTYPPHQGPHSSPSLGHRAKKWLWGDPDPGVGVHTCLFPMRGDGGAVGMWRKRGREGRMATEGEREVEREREGEREEGRGHCRSRSRSINIPRSLIPGNELHIWSHFPGRKNCL